MAFEVKKVKATIKHLLCSAKTITPIDRFNFGLAVKRIGVDRPPTGFCIVFLLGSKYAMPTLSVTFRLKLGVNRCFYCCSIFFSSIQKVAAQETPITNPQSDKLRFVIFRESCTNGRLVPTINVTAASTAHRI